MNPHESIVALIKNMYKNLNPIMLHAPVFSGNEKKYLSECIDTTYVSYVGEFVNRFEQMTASFTGAKSAVATVNGTTALQIALQVAGVQNGDEVITQSLTFVATANAIFHCGAIPVFIDVDLDTMGMSPDKLSDFLKNNTIMKNGQCYNKHSDRNINAIIPMHTFGHPCRIDEIVEIANMYHIPVIEDAAESLGSTYKNKHTGTFGLAGIISYNGNKTITTGGGGMIITNNTEIAEKARHLTTTAKVKHPWEFIHDQVGYNYRMPNVNAAIGVAQMENIDSYLSNKKETAHLYENFFKETSIQFCKSPEHSESNYWLNAILFKNSKERNGFLRHSNSQGVITRPVWKLMNHLRMYQDCQTGALDNSQIIESRLVNIPSGFRKTDTE